MKPVVEQNDSGLIESPVVNYVQSNKKNVDSSRQKSKGRSNNKYDHVESKIVTGGKSASKRMKNSPPRRTAAGAGQGLRTSSRKGVKQMEDPVVVKGGRGSGVKTKSKARRV